MAMNEIIEEKEVFFIAFALLKYIIDVRNRVYVRDVAVKLKV